MAQAKMEQVRVKANRSKVHVFDVVNYVVFVIVALIVLIPIWKVVVDSFNAVGVYQFKLWPEDFTVNGYLTIFTTVRLYRPFLNSVITTVLGTLLGLVLSTLGGYVLTQNEMPGRSAMSFFLLFILAIDIILAIKINCRFHFVAAVYKTT